MNAHVPTMFLMLIVVSATLAVSVGAVARTRNRDGMVLWAGAMALYTAAYVLFSLRNQISDLLSIVAANAALASVPALFAEGLLQFQQRRLSRWLIWLPVALMTVFFFLLMDKLTERLIIGSVISAFQCVVVLGLLLQKRSVTVGRGQYFVAIGLLLGVGVFAFRAVLTATGMTEISSHIASNTVQSMTFMASAIILILVGMGFVLMTKERADERNRMLAMRDELTGLPNRRFVIESLNQQMAQAQRSELPLTLLIIDIDHFKRINDNFGHLSGDQALLSLSNIIRSRLRTQDIFGRFGGEEFLVILPNTTTESSYQVAESLREGVASTRFKAADGQTMPVTISIGLYTQNLKTDRHCDDLISAADRALYRAKDAGRNCVEVFATSTFSIPVSLDLFKHTQLDLRR